MTNEEIVVKLTEHEQRIKSLQHRMDEQEEQSKVIQDLALSVKELALNMKNMMEEQKNQGGRLLALESRDGKMWRKVTGYIITAVVGIVIGYVLKQIGIF